MKAIIGHAEVRKELERLLTRSEIPGSYLFFGPRHVGKRLVAEWFAEKLVAETLPGSFSQNLLLVEPLQVTTAKRVREEAIKIETIREAQKFLALSPVAGKRRVLIIDGAEKLSPGAGNALLKILEEPPRDSAIILLTSEAANLMPTLLSRVVPFQFRPVRSGEMLSALGGAEALPQFFVDLGLPGVVVTALKEAEQFDARKKMLRDLFQLSTLSLRARMDLAEALAKDEALARDLLEIWCVGLAFQVRSKAHLAASHYSFLEALLATLKTLSQGIGTARPLLEKLFFSL